MQAAARVSPDVESMRTAQDLAQQRIAELQRDLDAASAKLVSKCWDLVLRGRRHVLAFTREVKPISPCRWILKHDFYGQLRQDRSHPNVHLEATSPCMSNLRTPSAFR